MFWGNVGVNGEFFIFLVCGVVLLFNEIFNSVKKFGGKVCEFFVVSCLELNMVGCVDDFVMDGMSWLYFCLVK